MPESLPDELAAALETTAARRGRLGHTVHFFTEVTSTNNVAARLADSGAADGTIVIAVAQTAGRGRLGRKWFSPPDAGVYVSVVCRDLIVAPFLTLAGGIAVAEGVRTATGLPVEIKWPNDVVVRTPGGRQRPRKIAGVLAEASSGVDGLNHVILGIGINVQSARYPLEIAERATSLEAELGRPVDRWLVLVETLAALSEQMSAVAGGNVADVLRRWRELAPTASGAQVECDTPTGRETGITAGIADDGALLVRIGARVERIVAGELVWR